MSVSPFPSRRFEPTRHVQAQPPAEVLAEIEVALEVADRLERDGVELRVGRTVGPRRLRFELFDADGACLRALRPAEVLELGAGRLGV
jgi:hypothetical protein